MATEAIKGAHYLVTGPSGSGKSYFARSLAEMGYPTYDSDEIPHLANWHDRTGQRVQRPVTLSEEFLREHRLLWDFLVLDAWLEGKQEVILFGISHNSRALIGRFAITMLLDVPVEHVLSNLAEESRDNAFGRSPAHQQMARVDTIEFYAQAPEDWPRLNARDPQRLVAQIEAVIGHSVGRLT